MNEPRTFFSYEPTWTKGPWMVAGVRGRVSQQAVHYVFRYNEEKKRDEQIAAVWYDEKTGLGFADAHLMSAAPNLADALIPLMVIALDALYTMDPETRAEAERDIEVARAALNKAMGKS